MSHEITVREDGTAEAAYALTPAWHGLGTVVDHAMTSEEALVLGKLNWQVEQEPVYQHVDDGINADYYNELPNIKINVRSDNNFVLGTVTNSYVPCQNIDAFRFMDALVMDGILKYEAVMSLQGGKQVIILARDPKEIEIKGKDTVRRFYMFSTRHDGNGGIQFGATSVRVVCMNTFRMAEQAGGIITIPHIGDVKGKMQAALKGMEKVNDEFISFETRSRAMADRVITRDEWLDYLDVVAPVPNKLDPDWTERREEAIMKTRKAIATAFGNDRNSVEGIGWTAWAAFNAVTEHVDHLPRKGSNERARSEARFRVTQYGTGHSIKERAYKAACRLVGVES